MFQYAAGKVLAEKHRTSLQMSVGRTADFFLYPFDTKGKVVPDYPPFRLGRLWPQTIPGETGRLRERILWVSKAIRFAQIKITGQTLLDESQAPDSAFFLGAKNHVFLHGYWQKHEYYEAIAPELAREFTVKTEPNAANADLLERIRASSEAVCVHVRRGDYLNCPHHHVCSPDYYRAAFRHLREALTGPVFFVFSDDLPWARNHLSPPGETHYVDVNGPSQGHEDMRLMRACSHFVIANSTFSWWPAWLADAPGKIVIAPKAWHTPEVDARMDLGRHCPENWLRL